MKKTVQNPKFLDFGQKSINSDLRLAVVLQQNLDSAQRKTGYFDLTNLRVISNQLGETGQHNCKAMLHSSESQFQIYKLWFNSTFPVLVLS